MAGGNGGIWSAAATTRGVSGQFSREEGTKVLGVLAVSLELLVSPRGAAIAVGSGKVVKFELAESEVGAEGNTIAAWTVGFCDGFEDGEGAVSDIVAESGTGESRDGGGGNISPG